MFVVDKYFWILKLIEVSSMSHKNRGRRPNFVLKKNVSLFREEGWK